MKSGLLALILFGGLVFPAAKPAAQNNQMLPVRTVFMDGDIILRNGKGFISSMMRNTSSKDKKYSHAGVIINLSSGPVVVHSIGNNAASQDGIRTEPLSSFIDRSQILQFGVYRYDLTTAQRAAIREKALEWRKKGIRFDEAFDLSSDDRMYCSELIFKLYNQPETAPGFIGTTTTPKGKYVGLDDLYLNPHCQLISEIHYSHE